MSQITKIKENKGKEQDRVWVYIDDEYCTSIRHRTWVGMDLHVGSEISCEELKERENLFWNHSYGEEAWKKEKVRLEHVTAWFKINFPSFIVDVSGFGADSNQMIPEHPEEKGTPDLTILSKEGKKLLMVEVTGTEQRRGKDYWIRPDKIEYIQKHADVDIWIALHYADQNEIIWIKPSLNKEYFYEEKNIRNAIEYYVIFNDDSEEVKSEVEFKRHLMSMIENCDDAI